MWMALPLLWKLGSVVAVLVALGGTWYGVKTHYYNQGWEAHKNATDKLDDDADVRAEQRVQIRKNCTDSGGTWNTALSVCERR